MNKKQLRQLIYDKYNGRCAYCGCELNGKFHVDEIEPVRRKQKWVKGHWKDGEDYSKKSEEEFIAANYLWVEGKWVNDGCDHPERFHVDNQNPACASCNINKHSMSLEEFRNLISGFMKHLNEINTQYKIAKRYGLVIEDIKPVVFHFETVLK